MMNNVNKPTLYELENKLNDIIQLVKELLIEGSIN